MYYLQVEHTKTSGVGRDSDEVHGGVFDVQYVLEQRFHVVVVLHADTTLGAQKRVFILIT